MGAVMLFMLLLLAAAIPDVAPSFLGLASYPPDVWLALTIYLAARAKGFRAVGWGITIGLIRDCLSLDPLGTNGFVLGAVALIFAEGARSRGRMDSASRFVSLFAASVLASWIYALRVIPLEGAWPSFATWLEAFPVALWTTLFAGLLLYPLMDRFALLDDLCGRSHAFSS